MTIITVRRSVTGMAIAVSCVLALSACTTAPQDKAGPTEATTRIVEHAAGTTEVPVRPLKVATLSEVVAGHLASVGLLVVAAPDPVPEWLESYQEAIEPDLDLSSITAIGTTEEPNFEVLAQVAPELIIIEASSIDLYPKLSQIAPTVVVERPTNDAWQEAFDQTVEAAGRTKEAEAVRESYQEQLADVAAGMEDTEVSFIRNRDGGSFRIDGIGAFGGSVAGEAGYAVTGGPADVPVGEFGFVELSGERLSSVTGNIIVSPVARSGTNTIQEFERNPLWAGLPAVQTGEVITVPNPVYNGGTYLAAELLLVALADAIASSNNP